MRLTYKPQAHQPQCLLFAQHTCILPRTPVNFSRSFLIFLCLDVRNRISKFYVLYVLRVESTQYLHQCSRHVGERSGSLCAGPTCALLRDVAEAG